MNALHMACNRQPPFTQESGLQAAATAVAQTRTDDSDVDCRAVEQGRAHLLIEPVGTGG